MDDIDQYLQQMQNESDDEDASGVRDIAKEHQLEKSSIANYIRIHNYLEYPIKQLLEAAGTLLSESPAFLPWYHR